MSAKVPFAKILLVAACLSLASTGFASTPFAWTNAAPSPITRVEAPVAAANGKLYMFGGFINSSLHATNRVDVYDPASNAWTRLPDMPIAVTHLTPAVDENTIWLAGGFVGANPGYATNSVWKFNALSNTWTAGPPLPERRGSGALVKLGRNLHFFGGYLPDRENNSTNHWVLSLDGGTNWQNVGALPVARGHMSAAVVNGKIFAIGGQQGHDLTALDLSRVDVYDPVSNLWTQAASLPFPRSHCELATFILNGRIVLVGGQNNVDGQNVLSDVIEYDPEDNIWIKLPSLPNALVSTAAAVVGKQIIIACGGHNFSTLPVSDVWSGTLEDSWEIGASMPFALSEVAGGIIGNKLHMFGDGNPHTAILNLSLGTWSVSTNIRPFAYHHHAADVYNGKIYVFGGLNDNGFGKTQIYNSATDSWTIGPDVPFLSGAATSALINGEIYVAGGIVNWVFTTTAHAKYNPISNSWTTLAPMPAGRNHAAGGTDGNKFYVFGGRDGGAGLANGFNTVQIYDPLSNIWITSDDPSSGIAPLPQARGGMSKAPFYNGEFYIIGGETENGGGATTNGVYDRVDIYNPISNTWRLGPTMPVAMHGIFPLEVAGRIYVTGGGMRSGYALSSLLENLNVGTPDPFKLQIQLVNGMARMTFPSVLGKNYFLQRRSAFGVETWTTFTNKVGDGGRLEISDPISGIRFYRVGFNPGE